MHGPARCDQLAGEGIQSPAAKPEAIDIVGGNGLSRHPFGGYLNQRVVELRALLGIALVVVASVGASRTAAEAHGVAL